LRNNENKLNENDTRPISFISAITFAAANITADFLHGLLNDAYDIEDYSAANGRLTDQLRRKA
jgi:hypothetical protein